MEARDRNTLPFVYTNKSNLITNYKAINISTPTKKNQEIRFRGSMFVNMLNNIKNNIVNRSHNKHREIQSEKQNSSKISLQIKNYNLNRNLSNQNHMPAGHSIVTKKNQRQVLQGHYSVHAREKPIKKHLQINRTPIEKHIIEEFENEPSKLRIDICEAICSEIRIHHRKQFHQLASPQWSVIIPLQNINYKSCSSLEKLEHLFSDMLFEGIDPIIQIKNDSQLNKLPSQLTQLCHIIYPVNSQIQFSSYKLVNLRKTTELPTKILYITSFQNKYTTKWIFHSQDQNHQFSYIKLNQLTKIKNIWIDKQTSNIKFKYEGFIKKQIKIEKLEYDQALEAFVKFSNQKMFLDIMKKEVQATQKSIEMPLEDQNKNLTVVLKRFSDKIIGKREEHLQNKNQRKNSIKAIAGFPKPRISLQMKSPDNAIMYPITNNPRRLTMVRNPDQFIQQLCRNNTLISQQINNFTRQCKDISETINRFNSTIQRYSIDKKGQGKQDQQANENKSSEQQCIEQSKENQYLGKFENIQIYQINQVDQPRELKRNYSEESGFSATDNP